MKRLITICAIVLLIAGSASAAPTYWADFVAGSQGAPFGGGMDYNGDGIANFSDVLYPETSNISPSVATGAPDPSFVSFLTNEYITLGFSTPFTDGAGNDFCVLETGVSGEAANVWVSSDGTNFTHIGIATSGWHPVGIYGYYNWFDLAGSGFTSPVSYVKVSDSLGGYSPGFDLVAIGANYPIPAPGAILLGSIGVGLVGWLRRRKTL